MLFICFLLAIALEGIIASGKTSGLNRFERDFGSVVRCYREKVEFEDGCVENLLENFCKGNVGSAFKLQIEAFSSSLHVFRESQQ